MRRLEARQLVQELRGRQQRADDAEKMPCRISYADGGENHPLVAAGPVERRGDPERRAAILAVIAQGVDVDRDGAEGRLGRARGGEGAAPIEQQQRPRIRMTRGVGCEFSSGRLGGDGDDLQFFLPSFRPCRIVDSLGIGGSRAVLGVQLAHRGWNANPALPFGHDPARRGRLFRRRRARARAACRRPHPRRRDPGAVSFMPRPFIDRRRAPRSRSCGARRCSPRSSARESAISRVNGTTPLSDLIRGARMAWSSMAAS